MKCFFEEHTAVVIICIVVSLLLCIIGNIKGIDSSETSVVGSGLLKIVGDNLTDTIDTYQGQLIPNNNLIKNSSKVSLGGSDFPNNSKYDSKNKITVLNNERFGNYATIAPYYSGINGILEVGKNYTLSAEIRTKNLTKSGVLLELCFRDPHISMDEYYSKADYVVINIPPNSNGKWMQLHGTFKYTDTSHTWYVLDITSGGSNKIPATGFKGVEIEYRNIKLEEGSKATPYVE